MLGIRHNFIFAAVFIWIFNQTIGLAADQKKELQDYLRTTSNLAPIAPSNYLASLKKIGVENPNSLEPFLNSKELQEATLNAMLAFELNSNQLTLATIHEIMNVVTNTPGPSSSQMAAIHLLLFYIEKQEVFNYLVFRVSSINTDLSDQVLVWLGQINYRSQAGQEMAKRVSMNVIGTRMIYATGGMAPEGRDSITNLISSVQWPLFEQPALANFFVDLIVQRLKGPWHMLKLEDYDPAMNFLLHESKAEPDHVAAKLFAICCDDPNLASAVLWKIDKSKDVSLIAKKTLELFLTQCDQNKRILQDIQAGNLKKEKAFDEAIEAYRASKRLH
ncbi:MAG: hypothetical protein P4N60_16265 [Verrucomicrobiae bacterium]|nr:hypothetical protein [Verrucomicrobiae bacterium]